MLEKIEGVIIDFPWKKVNKNYLIFEVNETKREKKKIFDTMLKCANIKW